MKHLPQIRLRTMFLFIVCAAVGMTTSADPLGWIAPAFETAIVVGLLQQARELQKCRLSEAGFTGELKFARRYAIFWRIAICILIVGCMVWRMLLSKKIVALPEHRKIFINDVFSDGLPQICVLIAVCNSHMRWRAVRSSVLARVIRTPFMWAAGIAAALTTVIYATLMDFLVHRAVFGIERSQRYRRTGVYINLAAEGYDAIWIGIGAVACLLAAIALVVHFRRKPSKLSVWRFLRWALFLMLLIPPIAFYIWYQRYELYRLSPDIGSVGLAIAPFDYMSGVILSFVAVTVGAYHLGKKPSLTATICDDLRLDTDRRAFHESFLGLALLVASAAANLFSIGTDIATYSNSRRMSGAPSLQDLVSVCCDPSMQLKIATIAASSQLLWTRWKKRNQAVPWTLFGLSPLLCVEGWIMLALLLVVGIPTVRAFAFLLWLGPYNLMRLFF
jgi:hypothetical protein